MKKLIITVIIILDIFKIAANRKPHCRIYGDTRGKWLVTKDILNSSSLLEEVKSSFVDNDPGEALLFDRVWIPDNCSYLRFSNDTIYKAVEYTRLKHNLSTVNIVFMGDSSSRGILSGITRILSGSELYGPCDNRLCGGINFKTPNVDTMHGYYEEFYQNLLLSFIYVKSFLSNHLDWDLEFAITQKKPLILVLNTGCWDFDILSRAAAFHEFSPICEGWDTAFYYQHEIEKKRNQHWIFETMNWLGNVSATNGNRVIYRNNHYNRRFGALCADKIFEENIHNKTTAWEILDSRNISFDVWRSQCIDGFHFDRTHVHSRESHEALVNDYKNKSKELPGMMEIQFGQSFLNAAFYDYVASLV